MSALAIDGVTVLVVDGVRLHRENLVQALSGEDCIAEVRSSADGEEAVRALGDRGFTVVLLSMAGDDGRAICRSLVAAAEPARVVAYGVPAHESDILICAEAGVAGYLLCDEPYPELMRAVATAVHGGVWCPSRVAAILMRRMGPHGAVPERPGGPGRLTGREREILTLIDDGMSNKEIARTLGIEVRTVKNHVHNLLEKLQVRRRGEAAAMLRGRSVGARTPRLVPGDQFPLVPS